MTSKPDRIIQIDLFRSISIIGVILIHITGSSFHFWDQGSKIWIIFLSLDQFFRFSVPLFVFISGYTLYSKYQQKFNFSQFYMRRVNRILPWYFVWSLINYTYIHLTVGKGFVDYPTWKLILLGKVDYHLYFVSMIFQLYLLFPILMWLYNKFKAGFVIFLFITEALLYFIFSLDGQKIIHLPWRFYEQQQYLFFGTWIFYFVLGFALSAKSQAITKFNIFRKSFSPNKIAFPLATLAMLSYAIYDSYLLINLTADTNVATRSTRIPLLLYSTGFMISALVYSNLFLRLNKYVLKFLLYFAHISFLVYLIHVVVMRILGNYILPSTVFNLIIFTLLVFLISTFLAQISLWTASLIPIHKIHLISNFISINKVAPGKEENNDY